MLRLRARSIAVLTGSAVLLATHLSWGSVESPVECGKMVGKASSLLEGKPGAVLFDENYEFICKANSKDLHEVRVKFTDPSGKTMVTESAVFRERPYLPETTFHDLRSGFQYLIHIAVAPPHHIELKSQKGETSDAKTFDLDDDPNAMTYLGAMSFVAKNLDRLEKHEKLQAKLIVPSRHDAYTVNFAAVDLPAAEAGGSKQIQINIELANALYRVFAPKMAMIFDAKTHDIVSFTGNAPILDEKSQPIPVEIKYRKL